MGLRDEMSGEVKQSLKGQEPFLWLFEKGFKRVQHCSWQVLGKLTAGKIFWLYHFTKQSQIG